MPFGTGWDAHTANDLLSFPKDYYTHAGWHWEGHIQQLISSYFQKTSGCIYLEQEVTEKSLATRRQKFKSE